MNHVSPSMRKIFYRHTDQIAEANSEFCIMYQTMKPRDREPVDININQLNMVWHSSLAAVQNLRDRIAKIFQRFWR